jgi:hypothetical protein
MVAKGKMRHVRRAAAVSLPEEDVLTANSF